MNRLFFTSGHLCELGCVYCFSKFNEEKLPIINYESIASASNMIIYPSCDSELFLDASFISFFDEYLQKSSGYNVFSFSTKRKLEDADLLYIKSLNDKMSVLKNGQIKLSISITTKTMVEQIEPNAASYYDRLALAKKIVELGIPTSVMLKPVLPFVPIDEFREIVDDFCAIGINSFITGDLYVETDSVFYRKYIENSPWTIKRKKVSWLKSKPTWTSIDSSVDLITEIKQYIREIGAHHYDSDQEFINLNLF